MNNGKIIKKKKKRERIGKVGFLRMFVYFWLVVSGPRFRFIIIISMLS